ncbi:DUF3017 domain-containing protein [Streptomyces antarcticus]|uniref:DUF3017 domain-containing protein n=1 Tax=Streptomyces antarcticus TaxID=2996458 RepID=UPI00226F4D77|nr:MULTISPECIES: DUF3017 domain-containing protein [unclassified Streptomyces]MCY0941694.1 DUF3017 domain-containing protein [Streptomyces sp. H34-AA3]MCZ4084323.1 DUF3017 domain-containing protein [Streptomyces sp. H34-S5]
MKADPGAEAATAPEPEPVPSPEPEPEPQPAGAVPAPEAVPAPDAAAAPEAGPEPVPEPAPARSRRFPSVTRDTARPEGSGRAVPGAVSAPARQWPMLSVLAATAAGLLATAIGHPRVGCLVIGAALIAASAMRQLLPSVGMLAVRSRFTDVATYGLLGVAITMLALVIEPKPWLEIPFLETAVRFTVR